MADRTGQRNLVKLSDSDFRLAEPWQDIRGLDVYDSSGEQIGTVEDLYVDEQQRKVRFLNVGAGGFLGVGGKHFLIPVEAVSDVTEDRVTLDQDKDKVTGAAAHDREDHDRDDFTPGPDYQQEVYGYYGYPVA